MANLLGKNPRFFSAVLSLEFLPSQVPVPYNKEEVERCKISPLTIWLPSLFQSKYVYSLCLPGPYIETWHSLKK
jgi:hypothetical protein